MSSMLEQAIVDAEALREAALKNAENMIVEKYSNQIRDAVETLLEQTEEEMGMDAPMAPEQDEDPAIEDMPVVTLDGEKLCPCPEEEEEYEIDLTQLAKLPEPDEDEVETQDDLAANVLDDMEEEDEEQPLEENTEIELSEDALSSLLEELVVDIEPALAGYGNDGIPNAYLKQAQEELLAKAQSTEMQEEIEALKAALKELQVENQTLAEDKEQLKEAVYTMKDKVEQSSLSNAKLLYTNKVLISDSLNERQKNKIVDAISETNSAEEAKIIFETLQNAVGSTNNKKPQSLSEAVRNSSAGLLLHGRRQGATKNEEPTLNRWKTLAGLNNN